MNDLPSPDAEARAAKPSPGAGPLAAFLAVLAMSSFLALGAIYGNSPMLDEYAHLPAVMSYWQLGRFSLYRETPPLIQCLIAIPPLASGAKVDYRNAGAGRTEWNVGRDFLIANSADVPDIFRKSRCIVLAMGLACGALVFWWAAEAYGGWAAVACAAIWLFDPSALAFSGIGTADVGSATFGMLACYAFWRFLSRPDFPRTVAAGLGFGLVIACKFNMVALYPAWLVLAAIARLDGRAADRFMLKMLVIGAIGLFVLNGLYLFDGTFAPLGDYTFKSRLLTGVETNDVGAPPKGNFARGTLLALTPTPLPRDFLLGFDSQKWESEVGLLNLSGGGLTRGGQWYGPLRTWAYKLPLGSITLILSALGYWALVDKKFRLREGAALIPAVTLMSVLCSQVGLNRPVRYSLSALPLLAVFSGLFVSRLLVTPRWRWLVVGCIAVNLLECLSAFPHFIAYANPIAGGPAAARTIFHGSNYDWGQDLYRFRAWYESHSDLRPLAFSYYGPLTPDFIGIPAAPLPSSFVEHTTLEAAGRNTPESQKVIYWAVSSNLLHGMTEFYPLDDGFTYRGRVQSALMSSENAYDRIGYSIYVFKIAPEASTAESGHTLSLDELAGCIRIDDDPVGIDAAP